MHGIILAKFEANPTLSPRTRRVHRYIHPHKHASMHAHMIHSGMDDQKSRRGVQ